MLEVWRVCHQLRKSASLSSYKTKNQELTNNFYLVSTSLEYQLLLEMLLLWMLSLRTVSLMFTEITQWEFGKFYKWKRKGEELQKADILDNKLIVLRRPRRSTRSPEKNKMHSLLNLTEDQPLLGHQELSPLKLHLLLL